MALKVRRVITGHDANGKAIVQIDEVVSKLKEGRPGAMVAPIWTTEGFPVNNDGHDDAATRPVRTTLPAERFCASSSSARAYSRATTRTDSIDYAIIMSGEIDMEMDGAMIHLKAGDVLVQRGTIHNWINTGTAPCVIAFALIDGKPVAAGGKVLNAVG
jgi:mannose-6-phosphate isomerase-like protein (cupin superfamily)